MPDGAVCLAYVHDVEVAYSWHRSILDLVGYDVAHDQRVVSGGWFGMRHGTGGIVEARNKVVEQFLAGDAEWLFWIDTDMGFAPDTVDRLLAAADPVERPVVGALCFAQSEESLDGLGGFRCKPRPTLFAWGMKDDGQQGFAAMYDYPRDQLVEVAGTGSACVLIHRGVLEHIATEYGPVWYQRLTNPSTGDLIAEDLSFCARLLQLGHRVHVDTRVKTSHLKHLWLQEADYLGQRVSVAPPATERVDVIVPVLRRPQNVAPFMESLLASTGLARVIAVCEEDDPGLAEMWQSAGATAVSFKRAHTFAEKVNAGFGVGDAPWVLIVGDDVRFHPGWLDHALAAAKGDRFDVVGTNDLGNPRVVSGDHGTHLLIRRSYIDKQGASWDGPGLIAHEGYFHWYVDDELVTVAKQRDTWTSAHESVIEHLHPIWGKAVEDDVYVEGQSHSAEDRELFKQRLAANTFAA